MFAVMKEANPVGLVSVAMAESSCRGLRQMFPAHGFLLKIIWRQFTKNLYASHPLQDILRVSS